MADTELAAMTTLVETLEPLKEDARERVVLYVQKRFNITATVPSKVPSSHGGAAGQQNGETNGADKTTSWSDFGELYSAYRPTSNSEKVLVAGYWFQVVEGKDRFTSLDANKLLKEMGAAIPKNIFRDFERLVDEKPSRVILLSGSGSGRNKYKLTVPGIKSVAERASQAGEIE